MIKTLLRIIKNIRFRYKLIISYFILSLVPVSILGIYSYNTSRNHLESQYNNIVSANLEQTVNYIEYQNERHAQFVNYTSLDKNVRNLLANDLLNTYSLQYIINQYIDPMITNYMVLSNSEILSTKIYSNIWRSQLGKYLFPDTDVKYKKWYINAKNQHNAKIRYDNNKIYFYRSIFGEYSYKFLGIIEIELNIPILYKNINRIPDIKYNIMISDKSKDVLLFKTYNADGSYKTFVLNEVLGKKIVLETNNNSYDVFKKKCYKNDIYISFYVPKNNLSSKNRDILNFTIIIIILCLVTLVFLIWIMSLTIVKRIEKLNRDVNLVSKNNSNIKFKSDIKDEIGNLSNSIGNMLVNIQNLININEKAIEREHEARLHLLQSQINPHFLYNILSIINWKAIETENNTISEITQLLSQFYRTTLNKGKDFISVKDELENVKSYISLYKIMHEGIVEEEYSVDNNILKYKMVNFVLQPLVENAIIHGIENKFPRYGKIKIIGRIKDDKLQFLVHDDGNGFSQIRKNNCFNLENTSICESKGYGLINVNERIKLLCGLNYGICIENDNGACITVNLPLLK